MERAAPKGARRRSSIVSQPFMRTETLDFSSFANPAVSYPRYEIPRSSQHMPLNDGPNGALPALNARSHSSMPTFSFPHNSALPVPKRLDPAQFPSTPQSHEGRFSTVGAQQGVTHRIDRPLQAASTHLRNASAHAPITHNARVMASSALSLSSSPYKPQPLPNFQQFAKNVQSNSSDRAHTSPPRHGHPYTTHLTSLGTTMSGCNQFHRALPGAHPRSHPSRASASSSAILCGPQYCVENGPALHPSSLPTPRAQAQVIPGSFPGASSSCTASQPICQPLLLATEATPALGCVINSSGQGTTAHVAKSAVHAQQQTRRRSSCKTPLLNDQRTCTNLTSSGTQMATMNPVSSVGELHRSALPGPGHAMVTGHPYFEVREPIVDSAHCLAPVSVPDLPPRHTASHEGNRNQRQTLTSGYVHHTRWSAVTTAPMILTGSRTLGQMSTIGSSDSVRLKQTSQKNRKRARGSGLCRRKDDEEARSIGAQTKTVRKERRPPARKISRSPQNSDRNPSKQCHPETVTESPLPSTDNRPRNGNSQAQRKKTEGNRKKRIRSTNGVNELGLRESQSPHPLGGPSPLSAIPSLHPNSPPPSNLGEGNRDTNEELHCISLSPCDEDEEMQESETIARHTGCVRRRMRSELENPTKQKQDLPISLRVKPPTNAYSPVSDDTQPLLTTHSSGDHSTEALNMCGARRRMMEKSSQELQSEQGGAASVPAKEHRKLHSSSKLTRDPASPAAHAMSKPTGKIPLRLRIRKPKGKASKRTNAPKRTMVSRRSTPPKPSRKRQVHDGAVAEGTGSLCPGESRMRKPSKLLAKPKALVGGHTGSKRTPADCEEVRKKPLSLPVRRMEKSVGKATEVFVRRPRISDVPAFTPVPIQEPSGSLCNTAKKFETELDNVRREGSLKRVPSHPRVGVAHHLRCQLCTDVVTGSQAIIHPRFSPSNFFLCSSCHKLVESRVKAEKPVHCESISDEPEAVLKRTALFVTVVENIVQAFPSTERESRDIASIHACISSRSPLQLQERAKFIQLPFQIVALLRVVLRRLGVTIQKNRLRWRMQPIKLPLRKDIVDVINQAIPPSLEDLMAGSSPGQRVWSTVFPSTELETHSSAYDIVSKLLALIGVRVHHLCKGNGTHCSETEPCQVKFDLLSVCATMHRAFLMVSGTLTEKLFKIWNPHLAKRFLHMADARLANETLCGKLHSMCSICASKKHPEKYPFMYYSCVSCAHEFCSLCMSNVMGPSEFAFACAGDYKCLLCRVDSTIHGKLLRNVGQYENFAKPKYANGGGGQNASRMKPQLPMLLVGSNIRKRLLSSTGGEDDAPIIGFSKFCEEANEHTCKAGPSSADAHLPSFAFPTKDAAAVESRAGAVKDRCFGCKLPVDIPGPGELRENTADDDEPMVLRCVSDNCGVVMHRECSPIEQGRRRRVGRPKWVCPRHRCTKCAYRDDSRLFKCRSCPLALCKDHMHKPSEVYIYSEKLFACVHCMKKLNPPRPCLIEKLPKRKNEFTQALNVSQAKRRRLAEAGSSVGLAKPYPGCIE